MVRLMFGRALYQRTAIIPANAVLQLDLTLTASGSESSVRNEFYKLWVAGVNGEKIVLAEGIRGKHEGSNKKAGNKDTVSLTLTISLLDAPLLFQYSATSSRARTQRCSSALLGNCPDGYTAADTVPFFLAMSALEQITH